MKLFIFLSLVIFSSFSFGANVNTPNIGKIQKINAYTDYGEGDVILFFDTGLAECPTAVWISPSSPGFNTVLSLALTAYTTKQDVLFGVLNDSIFQGGLNACKVKSIRFDSN